MKLNLGYIVIGIFLVILAIRCFTKKSVYEGLDTASLVRAAETRQEDYLQNQDKYWKNRKFPQTAPGLSEDVKFKKLDASRSNLLDTNPSADVKKSEIGKKIEKCQIINKTLDCDQITAESGCGYCWETNKILYGDTKGPTADVCGKNWVKPGPEAAFQCKKKKEQTICNGMKDCGDTGGEKSICGWCPTKAKGMVKKNLPGGGFGTKYDDDKCNWKEEILAAGDTRFVEKKDLTTKLPSQFGQSRKWHDRDGKYYDCEKYAEGSNCQAWGNGYTYQNLTGNKACVACGGGTTDFPFKGDLLYGPEECKKFEEKFPCLTPTWKTGPHSEACLDSLWGRSGCNGNLEDRVSDQEDYKWWNSHSYILAGENMKQYPTYANTGADYTKSDQYTQKCYGKPVDPCETRFNPRPNKCATKIFKEQGCTSDGKYYVENPKNWLATDSSWGRGTTDSSYWSNSTLATQVRKLRDYVNRAASNPKSNFDAYVTNHEVCYGTKPSIPWDKPCWTDFVQMMTVTEYIKFENNTLNFSGNSGGGFKAILPITNVNQRWKEGMAWKPGYILTKEMYEMEYFPFWQFVKTNKSVWNSRWADFKKACLGVPGTKLGGDRVNATWKGWNDWLRNEPEGQGDCDRDSDCAGNLKCAQNPYSLPGVNGNGLFGGGRDFCYDPTKYGLPSSGDYLIFTEGSPFRVTMPTKSSVSSANSSGRFYKAGNNFIVTKEAYMNEDFPYWKLIRVSKSN